MISDGKRCFETVGIKGFALSFLFTVPLLAFGYDIHPKCLTPIVEDVVPSVSPVVLVRKGVCDFRIVWDRKDKRQNQAAQLLSDCFAKATGTCPLEEGKAILSFVHDEALEREEGYAIRTTAGCRAAAMRTACAATTS